MHSQVAGHSHRDVKFRILVTSAAEWPIAAGYHTTDHSNRTAGSRQWPEALLGVVASQWWTGVVVLVVV